MSSTGFVGLDSKRVETLVRLLEGGAEDIRRFADRADAALERVAYTVRITEAEQDVAYLRAIGRAVEEMAANAERRLREFDEAERFERMAAWGERSLGAVAEAVADQLEEAERWVPAHWELGKWIPGFWKVERQTVGLASDGVAVEVQVTRATRVPGHFAKTWVEGEYVADESMHTAGAWLGRSMVGLEVGLAGWEEWSHRPDLQGIDRAAHAAWGGATIGLTSAAGGYLGYAAGAAAVGAMIGAAPVLPIAGAAIIVGGMAGALIGSEAGHFVGGLAKQGGEKLGSAVVGGAKKVIGWFR